MGATPIGGESLVLTILFLDVISMTKSWSAFDNVLSSMENGKSYGVLAFRLWPRTNNLQTFPRFTKHTLVQNGVIWEIQRTISSSSWLGLCM